MSESKPAWRAVLQPEVIVGSLGYFVDIYDLILFSILRIPSLKALGYEGQQLIDHGILLLNCQMAGMKVIPVYAVAEKAGTAIADVAATLGVDELYLGASGHPALAHLLHGSVVQQVVRNLPDEIAVVIRG